MSKGIRCDGCKEMIDDEGYDDYLELTLERREPPASNGVSPTTYYRSAGTKHFHKRSCLRTWVEAVGWWDGPFADLDLTQQDERVR